MRSQGTCFNCSTADIPSAHCNLEICAGRGEGRVSGQMSKPGNAKQMGPVRCQIARYRLS